MLSRYTKITALLKTVVKKIGWCYYCNSFMTCSYLLLLNSREQDTLHNLLLFKRVKKKRNAKRMFKYISVPYMDVIHTH